MTVIDRQRELNPALMFGTKDGIITPYQILCSKRHALIREDLRPSPEEFVTYEPTGRAALWRIDAPPPLQADVTTDSAVDIVRKLQMRSTGGCQVVNAHATTVTDQFVKSDHSHVAAPGQDGAHFVVSLPVERDINARMKGMEEDPNIVKSTNQAITPGHRVFSFRHTRLSLGQKPIVGEKTAKVFEPRDAIPHLNTPAGARLDSFYNLAMRVPDPISVYPIVATELRAVANISLPKDYVVESRKYAGDPYVRAAAIGDRKYHAMAAHPSSAGCITFKSAPLTQTSFGGLHAVSWQSVRTGARSIGKINLSYDLNLQLLADKVPTAVKIGYNVAKDSLVPFVVSINSIRVMSYLQTSDHPSSLIDNQLIKMDEKRVLESILYTQGGVKDKVEYAAARTEAELAMEEAFNEAVTENVRYQVKIALAKASVAARAAIVKPAISQFKVSASDDMNLRIPSQSYGVRGIS